MLSETVVLPKDIAKQENRFIIKLKEQLLKQVKQINELEKRIKELEDKQQ